MNELSFDDYVEAGRSRRDAGARLAENSVHTSWRLAAEEAIRRLAATGRLFTSDDLHDAVGDPPGHVNSIGSLFLTAARRGEIVADGYRTSARAEAHARPVRLWRGTRQPAETPAKSQTPREPERPASAVHDATAVRRAPTGTWSVADVTVPCVVCRKPAFLRDPEGHPRHRVCTGDDSRAA